MHYFVASLLNRIPTLLSVVSTTECTHHQPWDTETPSHKILHDKYYEKWGTIDKIQHKLEHKASTPWPRIKHTRITTHLLLFEKNIYSKAIKTEHSSKAYRFRCA